MSALKKKIAEKKAAEAAQRAAEQAAQPPPPPPSAAGAAPSAAAPAAKVKAAVPAGTDGGIRQGWLSKGSLYPEGSNEAAPKLWRAPEAAGKVFQLFTTEDEYEVRGEFQAAQRCLGKEDFAVTRDGLQLRIKGNPNDDPQSLVAALDETITLPADAAFEGMSAEYTKTFALSIKIPRSREMRELLAQLSVEEREAITARLANPPPEVFREEAEAAAKAAAAAEAAVDAAARAASSPSVVEDITEEVAAAAAKAGAAGPSADFVVQNQPDGPSKEVDDDDDDDEPVRVD